MEITRTLYKVSDFVSWQRAKTLVLSPSFQRRPVWKPGAKSFFIDSIARGLPIPKIFLRERRTDLNNLEPKREVVDGQQRIRTVITYIDPKLLIDYKPQRDDFTVQLVHNEELGDKRFSELPHDLKSRILDYQFSVDILPADTDDREVLQLFARLNATGVKLNDQELRNAEFFGELKTSTFALAAEQLPRWRKWKIFTEDNIARMQEVELTSEFILLMLKGITGKSQSSIGRLYKNRDKRFQERSEIGRRFRITMDSIDDNLGEQLPLLPFRKKALFYSLFAVFYDIQFGLNSSLTKGRVKQVPREALRKIKRCAERIEAENAPSKVLEAVARRTTHVSSRESIVQYLQR